MLPTYEFIFRYQVGHIASNKDCKSFADAVDYAADQFALLQEPGAVVEDMGNFLQVEIIHSRTRYTIATLYPAELMARKNAVTVNVCSNDPDNYRSITLQIQLGGMDFIAQAERVLGIMADQYLEQFNLPDASFPLPCTYLNVPDAKRNLQYLVEFIKIAQFQLSGNSARTW